jgi:phosphatidate cytidylyltransferase
VKTNLWEEISAQSWKAHMFGWLVKNDAIISYLMYIGGFVMFVARLRKSHYMYQFGQYGWTHMILLVIVIQSSCFVANIFEGLWYVAAASSAPAKSHKALLMGAPPPEQQTARNASPCLPRTWESR